MTSNTEMSTMSQWMKEWGQFIVLLIAVVGTTAATFGWGFAVLRDDIARVESGILENQRAVSEFGREVSELRGELRGRDLIARGDDG